VKHSIVTELKNFTEAPGWQNDSALPWVLSSYTEYFVLRKLRDSKIDLKSITGMKLNIRIKYKELIIYK
jgi:hypothetical protein